MFTVASIFYRDLHEVGFVGVDSTDLSVSITVDPAWVDAVPASVLELFPRQIQLAFDGTLTLGPAHQTQLVDELQRLSGGLLTLVCEPHRPAAREALLANATQ